MRADLLSISNSPATGASIAERGVARSGRSGSDIFSKSLAEASAQILRDSSRGSSPQINANAISHFLQTAPSALDRESFVSANRAQPSKEKSKASGGQGSTIVTPFGTFNGNSRGNNNPNALTHSEWGPMSGMRAYFYTHQPGEWIFNPVLREEFSRIYGQKALITADWTFTVPENCLSEWVTSREVDETGRPLPRPVAV